MSILHFPIRPLSRLRKARLVPKPSCSLRVSLRELQTVVKMLARDELEATDTTEDSFAPWCKGMDLQQQAHFAEDMSTIIVSFLDASHARKGVRLHGALAQLPLPPMPPCLKLPLFLNRVRD